MKSLLLNANGNIDFFTSAFFFFLNQKIPIYLPISILSSALFRVSVPGKCQAKVTKWVSGHLKKQREDLSNGVGLLSRWAPSLLMSVNSPQEPDRVRR